MRLSRDQHPKFPCASSTAGSSAFLKDTILSMNAMESAVLCHVVLQQSRVMSTAAGRMSQRVRSLCAMMASYNRTLVGIAAALLPNQLPPTVPWKAVGDGTSTWAPATLRGRCGRSSLQISFSLFQRNKCIFFTVMDKESICPNS